MLVMAKVLAVVTISSGVSFASPTYGTLYDNGQNTSALVGVGNTAANADFRHAFIGGFDLRLSLANRALEMTRVSVDATNYSASGDDATGGTSVYFEGVNPVTPSVENVTAIVDVVSIATPSAYSFSNASHSVSGQSSIVNNPRSSNTTLPTTAKGAFLGLRKFNLWTSSGPANISYMYAGCQNFGFSVPWWSNGTVTWQDNYGFLANYDASTDCRLGWLP